MDEKDVKHDVRSPGAGPQVIRPGEKLSPAAREALQRRSGEELAKLAERANRRS